MKVIKRRGYVAGERAGPVDPGDARTSGIFFLAHSLTSTLTTAHRGSRGQARRYRQRQGRLEERAVGFLGRFAGDVESLKGIRTSQVVDVLDATLGAHFFGDDESSVDARLSAIERGGGRPDTESIRGLPDRGVRSRGTVQHQALPRLRYWQARFEAQPTGGFIGCSNTRLVDTPVSWSMTVAVQSAAAISPSSSAPIRKAVDTSPFRAMDGTLSFDAVVSWRFQEDKASRFGLRLRPQARGCRHGPGHDPAAVPHGVLGLTLRMGRMLS